MGKKKIENIVILGSGNVASHLGIAFLRMGINILQVYSRNYDHAKKMADQLKSKAVHDVSKISLSADMLLFCISDSAFLPVLEQRKWNDAFLVHTAGTVSADVFKPFTGNYGVLYPYQSLTENIEITFSSIPLFVEANTQENKILLNNLAAGISERIYSFNSNERAILHLAGVFANNFSNHMFLIAHEILKKAGLPVNLIHPLIEETTRKAIIVGTQKSQTGPALRQNANVMKKHIEMLEANPDWQKIYTFASESISKYHNTDGEL